MKAGFKSAACGAWSEQDTGSSTTCDNFPAGPRTSKQCAAGGVSSVSSITRLAAALPPVVFTPPCVASAGCLAGSWPLARACVCVASRPQASSRKLRCPPARLPQVRGCPWSLRVAPMLAQGGSLAAGLPTGACLPCPRGVGRRRSPGAHLQARPKEGRHREKISYDKCNYSKVK